jgi:hypothetical protein
MKELKTRGGRKVIAVGQESLLTMDRLQNMLDRFDTDPRIVSVSIYPGSRDAHFTRATGPAGLATLITTESQLSGELTDWAEDLSNRGFWHDWYVLPDRDVKAAESQFPDPQLDQRERTDPSSSQFHDADSRTEPKTLTIAIDVKSAASPSP